RVLFRSYANTDEVDEVEAFRVLGQDRREIAFEGHIVADKTSIADSQRQSKAFVIGVTKADGELNAFEAILQLQESEAAHSVRGDGVLVAHHLNVAKRQGLDQCLNDLNV